MTSLRSTIWILMAATALAVTPAVASAKCMAPGQVKPIVMQDGQASEQSTIVVDKDDVAWVAVLCWSPSDSTLRRSQHGYGVIYLVTTAETERLHRALEDLAGAQARYFGVHGRYTDRWADLGLEASGVELELEVEADAWHATARGEATLYMCRTSAAESATEGATEGASDMARPECALDEESTVRITLDESILELSRSDGS